MADRRKPGRHRKSALIRGLLALALVILAGIFWLAWTHDRASHADGRAVRRVSVEDLPTELELFESVFWEPRDTTSLREWLRDTPEFVADKTVLDIGTGSGLLALCCCRHGAAKVVATDVNPNAVACARHNAKRLGYSPDVRLVSPEPNQAIPTAFAAIEDSEQFDVIMSNPPWEDGKPSQWSDFALYDPDFRLLRSILQDAPRYLRPGGKIVLAYGCVEAIECLHRLAKEFDYDVVVLDDRDLDSLPPVFVPGMLLGLTPSTK